MPRPFHFKRFTVVQHCAAMKVGTDGVLLGAWFTVSPQLRRILDVGTGTGLIALMAAQRTEGTGTVVTALEPEAGACEDAAQNFAASPWADRLDLRPVTVQEYSRGNEGKFDLVISNPPYFENSLLPPVAVRAAARHCGNLSRDHLMQCSSAMLRPDGYVAVIIPYDQAVALTACAHKYGLMPTRRTDVAPVEGAQPRRCLMEFRKTARNHPLIHDTLVIENGVRHGYTDRYRRLTADFYLKF